MAVLIEIEEDLALTLDMLGAKGDMRARLLKFALEAGCFHLSRPLAVAAIAESRLGDTLGLLAAVRRQ